MSKSNYRNSFFSFIIYFFMMVFLIFILLVISTVLYKGIPNLFELILEEEILFSIKLSFFTSTVSTLICLLFSIPISYGLARYNFPFKNFINSILQVPISLPPLASGLALLLTFSIGYISNFLDKINLNPIFTIKGIILAHFFLNVPYMIRILRASIEDINPRLEFVSRTLGYSNFKTFFKVTIPLAKRSLFASIVITWSKAIGEFGTVLMLAGTTRFKTETLPASIFLNVSSGDVDKALTSSVILIIISFISLFIFGTFEKTKYY
ncbi:molybdate ABC transporter permease protein ModB [Gottschalkia purinilytica]|uniref:Molybdate ABC transporter permease protein ModB n=1 Tax=Gottschalkia purinilytica TaxID=1503 RepID=A0A0L0W9C9_GOTPU|nr:ABC transporter permease [Gottschalkia purinilytica]KNF07920.1 molybdate ABC transporter permease protein ModB [Gottschalkia purinilytica]